MAPREKVAVSIVMPAYNAELYIQSTIESVLSQTYQSWELIVVDDCSTDSTVEIVEGYVRLDSRVQLICLNRNFGAPAGPRNIGVKAAIGEWIAFLDSDDIWHPAKLASQMKVLQASGAKFCSTSMQDFVGSDVPVFSNTEELDFEWVSFTKQLLKYRTPTSSVVVSKNLIETHPFNESISYKAREDLDCWLRCHEILGQSVKIITPMLGYRIIDGQISGSKLTMVKRHLHVLKNYYYQSGRKMSVLEALFFTASHFILATVKRGSNRGL